MIKKQRRDCGAVASSTTARQPLSLLQTSIVPYKSESRMGRDSRKYMNDRIESIWLSCFLTTISLLPHTLAIDDPCSAVPFLASTNSNYDVSFFHNLHRPLFSRGNCRVKLATSKPTSSMNCGDMQCVNREHLSWSRE